MNDRLAYKILFIIFLCCIALFLISISFRFSGSLIRSDGISYYSYLRSFVFDKDFNHNNEFIHFGYTPSITLTGYTHNLGNVGSAMFWLPFYLVAHFLVIIFNRIGLNIQMDGYSFPYQLSVCTGTIGYVSVAFFMIYGICRRYFSEITSILAVLGIWLAGSPLYYTTVEPSMSQGVQLFSTTLFIYVWLREKAHYYTYWVFIGMSIGLMALVHSQGLIFLTILVVDSLYNIIKSNSESRKYTAVFYIKGVLIAISAGFFIYLPQIIVWIKMFGSPLVNSYPYGLDYMRPHILEYLFSLGSGLFTWTPIILFSLFGIAHLYKKDQRLAVCLSVTLIFQCYFYSSIGAWAGSYGGRHFVSSAPLFVLTIAAFFEAVMEHIKKGLFFIVPILFFLICRNLLLILQYSFKIREFLRWYELILGKFVCP